MYYKVLVDDLGRDGEGFPGKISLGSPFPGLCMWPSQGSQKCWDQDQTNLFHFVEASFVFVVSIPGTY